MTPSTDHLCLGLSLDSKVIRSIRKLQIAELLGFEDTPRY